MHKYNVFRIRSNESVRVLLDNIEPTSQDDDIIENDDNENEMTIEVLGDMPKVIGFEEESIIQVLIFNLYFMNQLSNKNLIIFLIFKKTLYTYLLSPSYKCVTMQIYA